MREALLRFKRRVALAIRARRERRFYSHSVALTLLQIQWLQNRLNASQLLRWLVEGAMATSDLDDKCHVIQRLEMRIGNIERLIAEAEGPDAAIYGHGDVSIAYKNLKELRRKRREAIASLVSEPGRDKWSKTY